MTKRVRGAPPKNKDHLITREFNEGRAKYTRAVVRRFNKHIKKDKEMRKLIDSGGYEYDDFNEVFNWVNTIEIPPHEKKRERDGITADQYDEIMQKAESNPLTCVAHILSKEAVEKFFSNHRLRFLFKELAPKI